MDAMRINAPVCYIIIPLILGFMLDMIIGDPRWLPHPVRMFGKAISFFENKFNHGRRRIIKGFGVSSFLIAVTWLFFFLLLRLVLPYPYLYYSFATMVVFYGLANRGLISEVSKVNQILR